MPSCFYPYSTVLLARLAFGGRERRQIGEGVGKPVVIMTGVALTDYLQACTRNILCYKPPPDETRRDSESHSAITLPAVQSFARVRYNASATIEVGRRKTLANTIYKRILAA